MTSFEPDSLIADLAAHGYAVRPLLDPATCRSLESLYEQETPFRKRIVMERHGYGLGEYKYFAYPLPETVADLRTRLYPPLASIANQWRRMLGLEDAFPDTLAAYLDRCHEAGQTRPTPLMLRYGKGGFNCLHQDLYGTSCFPCSSSFCSAIRTMTSPAGSSCWSNSARAPNRKARSCACAKAKR